MRVTCIIASLLYFSLPANFVFGSTDDIGQSYVLKRLTTAQNNTNRNDILNLADYAKHLMDAKNHPINYQIITKFGTNGNILSVSTNRIKVWKNDGDPIFTESEETQIIDSITNTVSNTDFEKLDPAHKKYLSLSVSTFVDNFPTTVPGQSLSAEDTMIKITNLVWHLRTKMRAPVVTVDSPHLLAEQISTIAASVGSNSVQAVGDPFKRDLGVRQFVIRGIEDALCTQAEDTSTPIMKRPLPNDQFKNLISTLMTNKIQNLSFLKPLFSDDDRQRLLNASDSAVSNYLSNSSRRSIIAQRVFAQEIPTVLLATMKTYIEYNKETDLATVDFMAGRSEKEWENHGKAILTLSKHEQQRQMEFQVEIRRKIDSDLNRLKQENTASEQPLVKEETNPVLKYALFLILIIFNALAIVTIVRLAVRKN